MWAHLKVGICLAAAIVAARGGDTMADLVRIHEAALGGSERIAALSALRATGHVTTGGIRVQFTLIAARPNRVRVETASRGRTLVQACDGVEPPWQFDTGTWPPVYRPMAEAVAKTFMADAEFDDPLVAGPARGFTLEYAGEMEVDARQLLRVLVTRNLSETSFLLLDPKTYLIVLRMETRKSGVGRPVPIVTQFDDYRPVDGVLLPHRISVVTDGRLSQRTEIEKIEPNPKISDDTFTRPKAAVK